MFVNFSSLIDESEETKKLNLDEDQTQPQLPSDEDMEDILEHIDEDVEIPDDDEEDLEDTAVLREIVSTDIHMLLCCEGIYMLRGWEHSVGARAEHSLAQFMKLHIQYE